VRAWGWVLLSLREIAVEIDGKNYVPLERTWYNAILVSYLHTQCSNMDKTLSAFSDMAGNRSRLQLSP